MFARGISLSVVVVIGEMIIPMTVLGAEPALVSITLAVVGRFVPSVILVPAPTLLETGVGWSFFALFFGRCPHGVVVEMIG
jgi:hypothetical protein